MDTRSVKIKTAVACSLMMLFFGGLSSNGFAVYQPYFISVCGFTNAQASLILTVRNLSSFLAMLFAGVFYRRLSLRNGITLAGACGGAGLLLFALARGSFFMNCLAGFIMGVCFGAGATIPMSLLAEATFTEGRKRVLGVAAAMTGLSTLGIPSLITAVIEARGLAAAFTGEGALYLVISAAVWLLLKDAPASGTAGSEPAPEQKQARALRPLGKKQIPLMACIAVCCGAVGFAGCTHLTVLCTGEGVSAQGAALAVSVFGITLTVSKALYGFAAERFGTQRCNLLYGAILTAGLLLMRFVGRGAGWMFLAMGVYAFGLASATVGLTVWASDLAPAGQHAKTARLFQLGYMGGSLLFTYMPGLLADLTGSYVPAFDVFALMTVLFTAGIAGIYRRNRIQTD